MPKVFIKQLKILYFGDAMGSCSGELKNEILDVKRWLKVYIFNGKSFKFSFTENPCNFDGLGYDIFIFDYGGIGFGASGLTSSLSRQILGLIKERPNTLYICWTHFTNEFLKDECDGELGVYPNLICRDDKDNCIKDIKKWLKLNR